jgi:hypothetical protein
MFLDAGTSTVYLAENKLFDVEPTSGPACTGQLTWNTFAGAEQLLLVLDAGTWSQT